LQNVESGGAEERTGEYWILILGISFKYLDINTINPCYRVVALSAIYACRVS